MPIALAYVLAALPFATMVGGLARIATSKAPEGRSR